MRKTTHQQPYCVPKELKGHGYIVSVMRFTEYATGHQLKDRSHIVRPFL